MLLKTVLRLALATIAILLVPLVAMQFTSEVNWTFFDFVFAGALLFGSGFTFVVIARKMNHKAYRAAVGLSVAAGLILI